MDFAYSPRVLELREQLWDFMNTHVIPAEEPYFAEFSAETVPHRIPAVMEDLKREARSRGLWNLFLPDERFGAALLPTPATWRCWLCSGRPSNRSGG